MTALIPINCWKIANIQPTINILPNHGDLMTVHVDSEIAFLSSL